MKRSHIAIGLLLATMPFAASLAGTAYPVDDSGSRVLGGEVRMRWDDARGDRHRPPTVSGSVAVQVRLDVTEWQGRQGRIFMTLPPQPAGRVDASWTTRGVLLPGALRDGGRTLVYAGPIRGPAIEDTQQLVIQADGGRLTRPEQLQFAFEIELESP
ncbi:hypothetical protein ACFFGH_00570 [Lysobacter korlensis]|uniref:Uncharacterized protein n=1 Tax=Lysobacter korlensis TaxID=553636 RepID=A0ABV6RH72_9GAMM